MNKMMMMMMMMMVHLLLDYVLVENVIDAYHREMVYCQMLHASFVVLGFVDRFYVSHAVVVVVVAEMMIMVFYV